MRDNKPAEIGQVRQNSYEYYLVTSLKKDRYGRITVLILSNDRKGTIVRLWKVEDVELDPIVCG